MPLAGTPITAGNFATFRFRYTVGRQPIEAGGHVRFSMRHVFHWSRPQTKEPQGAGYIRLDGPPGVTLKLLPWTERSDSWDLFLAAFPWQHAIEARVVSGRLNPGNTITLTYGDRTNGGPGAQIQPSQERLYTFRVYVAPRSNEASFPLAEDIPYEVIGRSAKRLKLVAPSQVVQGEPLRLTIRAEDEYGNQATGYSNEIDITTPDDKSVRRARFRLNDRGVIHLNLPVPQVPGILRLVASDGSLTARSNPIRVTAKRPATQIYWGDIHGHTLVSDGRGTVDEFYQYCRDVAALDFCAVTDHGYMIQDSDWQTTKEITEKYSQPGRFVTFQAYEWSGKTDVGGDHNIYFRSSDPPIFRSRSYYDYRNQQTYHGPAPQVNFIEDLFSTLLARYPKGDVLAIPHYGGRKANPAWHNPRIERLIELFSDHQRSYQWAYAFLKKGYRLGIMASTDNHTGRPGNGFLHNPLLKKNKALEIGTALTATIADDLTRDSIFTSLFNRRTYATTGDRILLRHADR